MLPPHRQGCQPSVSELRSSLRRGLQALAFATALLALGSIPVCSSASAKELFVLDSQATTPGNVVEDSAGNAYVGWTHRASSPGAPAPVMFCKIPAGGTCTKPITLPIPGATSEFDDVDGVFPVLGPTNTVYVVGARYTRNDVVVWTSTNGGESFNSGSIDEHGYSDKTSPSGAVLSGKSLLIAGSNSGLGSSAVPVEGGPGANFSFASPGSGGVGGSTLGLDTSGDPVEAYWNLASPEPTAQVLFFRYKGSGPLESEADWEGPSLVADGEEPRLAGGAGGLFLASLDYGGGSSEANLLNVRRYSGSSFGAPLTLANKASASLFAGGAIAESPNGSQVAVAWPGKTSAGEPVMDLFTSGNSGATFGASSDIAKIEGYEDGNEALAIGNNGQGWLSYLTGGVLRVADLTPMSTQSS